MLPPQPWFKKCISVGSVWVFWTPQRRGTSLRRTRCARAEPARGGSRQRRCSCCAGEGHFPRDDSRGCRGVPQACQQLPSCRAVGNSALSDSRVSAGLRDRLQGLLFSGDFVLQGLIKLPR